MSEHPLAAWHRLVRERDPRGLDDLLDAQVVFFSPLMHMPQHGKQITALYLGAAMKLLGNASFRYVREIVASSQAMLEFETQIDGVLVNGVDIIGWNEAGKITEFKVMVRPLKAIELIHQRMAAMLQSAQPKHKESGHD